MIVEATKLNVTQYTVQYELLRFQVIGSRRGELKQMVPVGFVHDAHDRVILDPDVQVQGAVRLFFETFKRTGSCLAWKPCRIKG